MDWNHWQPRQLANLCFIVKDGRVLLIRKKRGLGAGKINGPGGRLEPGETTLAAAIRETQEEHWLPHVLAGGSFQGWFEFDGEKMLSKRVELSA